ncbi:MAG: N-6 DNA methylase, partial [Deltaproteobacteria bacterium]|nr:N-6 DNA methylase [Deltaproteobacteria bacterium]
TAQQLGSLIKSARDIMRKDKGLNGDLDRLPMLTWIMFLKFLDDMEMIREQEAKLSGKKYRPAIDPPYRWRDWAAREDGISGDELLAFVNQDEATRQDGQRGPGILAYLRALQSANGRDRRDVIANVFRGVQNRMINGYLLRDVINKVNGIHFDSSEEIHTLSHLYEAMLREMRDSAGDSGEFYTPRPVVQFMVAVTNPQLGETVLDPACGTGGFLVEAFSHLEKQCKTVKDRQTLQENSIFGQEAKPLPYMLCQMNLLLHGLEYPTITYDNSLAVKVNEIGDRDRVDVIMTNPPFGGEEEAGIKSNFPNDMQTSETALLFLQLIMHKLKRPEKNQGRPGQAAVVVPESVMGDAGIAQRIRKELIDRFNLHAIVRLPKGVFEPYSDIQTNLLFFDRSSPTEGIWFYQHEVPPERQCMRNPCYTRTYPLKYEELLPAQSWWTKRCESDKSWYISKAEIVAQNYSLDFRNPKLIEKECAGPIFMVSAVKRPIQRAFKLLTELEKKVKSIELILEGDKDQTPLRVFLSRFRKEVIIRQEKDYKQITVKLYGKGVRLRKIIRGQEIRTRPQFIARAGQLIMSRIDARNGAFGLIPYDLDGSVVTQDFPLFNIDTKIIEPGYLSLLLRSEKFIEACRQSSRGTTNRKRLKEDIFLEETVPVPSIHIQKQIAELVNSADAMVESVLLAASSAEDVIPSFSNYLFERGKWGQAKNVLDRAFEGEL